jgi:4-hydroxy-3-methylbut-2-enyl diphosphate reductase
MTKPPLTLLLAAPRGFCAGVVESLRAKGAVFVDELTEVPDDAPVIFSAHGVPKSVSDEAEQRKLVYVDATCPLVSKVHREAERHFHHDSRHLLLIGHAGHPEVVGTMGQVPEGAVTLVETVTDAERVEPPADAAGLAYVTQTTLSVDDTAAIIAVLRRRFPHIQGPKQEDICYATTNRQQAVKAAASRAEALLVIGSPNSSNSSRLVEVAKLAGCDRSLLVDRAADIDWNLLDGVRTLALSAGASAPESLVQEVTDALAERFTLTVEPVETAVENVEFKLPRLLVA